MKKAVSYSRFSPRPNGEHCDSAEKQAADIREYCERKGYVLVGEFSDKALSGADDERPGLDAAIDACRRRSVLVVRSIDRLARGNSITEGLLLKIAAKGASIETLDGVNTLTETPEQELLRVIMQGLAGYQRRKIKDLTSRRMRALQKQGRLMSNRAPFGTKEGPRRPAIDADGNPVELRTLVPDDAEQRVLGMIMDWRRQGYGYTRIARELDAAGHTCRGGRWHKQTVYAIVRRELSGQGQLVLT